MPVITLAIHPTSSEIKKDLISSLTKTAAAITGIGEQAFVVFVDEYRDEAIGVGGRTLREIKAAQ